MTSSAVVDAKSLIVGGKQKQVHWWCHQHRVQMMSQLCPLPPQEDFMELNQFYWIKTESKSQKTKSKEIFVLGMRFDSSTNQSWVFNRVTRNESKWAVRKTRSGRSLKTAVISIKMRKLDGHLIINWTAKKVRQLYRLHLVKWPSTLTNEHT